jgi:hypothetical protein
MTTMATAGDDAMVETYQGGCHCGRVRFRVRADLSRVVDTSALQPRFFDGQNWEEAARARRAAEGG